MAPYLYKDNDTDWATFHRDHSRFVTAEQTVFGPDRAVVGFRPGFEDISRSGPGSPVLQTRDSASSTHIGRSCNGDFIRCWRITTCLYSCSASKTRGGLLPTLISRSANRVELRLGPFNICHPVLGVLNGLYERFSHYGSPHSHSHFLRSTTFSNSLHTTLPPRFSHVTPPMPSPRKHSRSCPSSFVTCVPVGRLGREDRRVIIQIFFRALR